ncbi:protein-L-isoaspartate O-methyltransferase family protein [Novosphingobium lentum]|uniref:protein-L-isoaspartate O-methyltransferase family protein n=1 Tax=Novosphingobium lentum TaxID=145287 RepID=UPI000829AAFA|nr:protein-L-isoaspartate O-methyltransferase [Novosphingobium lentum]
MTVVEQQPTQAQPAAARRAMIDSQLRVSGVNDPAVLAAFASVAREDFVPEARHGVAYADRSVPLGNGRVLAPALTHGKMLIEAAPVVTDSVLIVGGGSGYLAAVVAPLVGKLTVVESDPALAQGLPPRAGHWQIGPLAEGNAAGAPYTLILIDGAIDNVPPALAAQLAEGGRLVTGLVERGVTRLATGRKVDGNVVLTVLAEADFAPLAEFAAPKAWSF